MKYECPKCNHQLKFWQDFGFTKERLINKQTGDLNRKVSKSKEYEVEVYGLACTKCNFTYYENVRGNDKNYEHLNLIFKKLSYDRGSYFE